ncbi:MAG: hypothetical protein XD93_1101 [candidate division WS6 bacterium 34_10]|uniref:Uncharacterized protein n=1 Tax=candidate division WS6 bacterium 34_10 TaxID=1641389 RepID=A0A101HFU1_9BACT|nr:MAG: hypothetical protein XD93_1101 [candidate division WS6 bacterium 34_10]
MATKSQKDFSWVVWLIVGILVIALLLPLIVKVGGSYYRWGFSRKDETSVVSNCQECPECPAPTIIYKEFPADEKISDANDYSCVAVDLGDGSSVGQSGSCSFCTINYSYPGDVIIAEEDVIEYTSDAWVWQYNKGDIDGFRECIEGQPFYSDPNYFPIWP